MIQIQDKTGHVVQTVTNVQQAKRIVKDARSLEVTTGLESSRLTAIDASTGLTIAGPGALGSKPNGRTARANARRTNA